MYMPCCVCHECLGVDSMDNTWMVIFHDGDVRECQEEEGELVHVLNPAFRISPEDPRIKTIKRPEPLENKPL